MNFCLKIWKKVLKKPLLILMLLSLCVGLVVPAMANGTNMETFYLFEEAEKRISLFDDVPESGNGWSWDGICLTLNGFNGLELGSTQLYGVAGGKKYVIELAAGSRNSVQRFQVTASPSPKDSVSLAFQGSGELIVSGDGQTPPFVCTGDMDVSFEDGLTISGGVKEGMYVPLLSAHSPVTAGDETALFVRVAPDPDWNGEKKRLDGFQDVFLSSPYAEAIRWAAAQKIAFGSANGFFNANNVCSRGHILTFLWRAYGSQEATVTDPFVDAVPEKFQKAAFWARERGLVSGPRLEESTFCTRSEAVTYLWKLAGSPTAGVCKFVDVPAGAPYAQAVAWALEEGITTGRTTDRFDPDRSCTRGQIVTYLYRYLGT